MFDLEENQEILERDLILEDWILEEDQTLEILEEDRTLDILEEDRTFDILEKDRTLNILEEDQIFEILEEDWVHLSSMVVDMIKQMFFDFMKKI